MSDSVKDATPAILTACEVNNSLRKLKQFKAPLIPLNAERFAMNVAKQLATAANKDAYLIDLGKQLDNSWQHEKEVYARNSPDETYEQAFEKSNAIVDKIRDSSATTLDGLKVKAKAVLWCHGGESFAEALECKTGDLKIVSTILDDLLKIGGER